MTEVTQRAATLDDLKAVWHLLRDTAAAVPFDLENEKTQESVLSEIMACCTSGLSPIVVAKDDTVVGALLVRRDDFEWGFRNSEAVHVAYAAAKPDQHGVLKDLLLGMQERKVPVIASVKSGNQFGLADALKTLGFAHAVTAEDGWGDLYTWQPARVVN